MKGEVGQACRRQHHKPHFDTFSNCSELSSSSIILGLLAHPKLGTRLGFPQRVSELACILVSELACVLLLIS